MRIGLSFRFDAQDLLDTYADSQTPATMAGMHRELALRSKAGWHRKGRIVRRLREAFQLALSLRYSTSWPGCSRLPSQPADPPAGLVAPTGPVRVGPSDRHLHRPRLRQPGQRHDHAGQGRRARGVEVHRWRRRRPGGPARRRPCGRSGAVHADGGRRPERHDGQVGAQRRRRQLAVVDGHDLHPDAVTRGGRLLLGRARPEGGGSTGSTDELGRRGDR
jgi:hypothetical protein